MFPLLEEKAPSSELMDSDSKQKFKLKVHNTGEPVLDSAGPGRNWAISVGDPH
jgi:hypothetical protein